MLSSTSSSNRARNALLAFLGLLAIYLTGLEWLTRHRLARMSRIQTRMTAEYSEAAKIPARQRQILLVGNSLMDASVNVGLLNQTLAPGGTRVTRWMIEQTAYYDWFYGLRRIFEAGSRPQEVWLALGPQHLISMDTRGDFSAQYMMNTRDVPSVAAETGVHPTTASGFLLASVSEFYGLRGELRKVLMGRLVPGYMELTQLMVKGTPARPMEATLARNRAAERLKKLNELCARYGAQFRFVLTPAGLWLNRDEVLAGGQLAGVTVWEPIPIADLSQEAFAGDGFHLSPAYQEVFTRALAGSH